MGRFAAAHADALRARKSGVKIDRIIVHATEGSIAGTITWFQMGKYERAKANKGREPTAAEVQATVATAAHYCISRTGEIVQMVPDDKKCYHAGSHTEPNWNDRSIGLEHEARINPWPVRKNAMGLVKPVAFPINDFPETMLASSATVTAVLCKKFRIPMDREHIVGHNEVPGATHTDPGPAWSWDAYMAMVLAAAAG